MLCSSKLWDILRISEIPGCAVEPEFIDVVTNELVRRSDFYDGWPLRPAPYASTAIGSPLPHLKQPLDGLFATLAELSF